jgi:adenylosuccinate synthase
MKLKIDLIMDLQYGSTGKGLLAGYLAETSEPDGVATCNMPNAGHTYVDRRGNTMIHKVLPNGIVSPKCKYVFIGPGAVFSAQRLYDEVRDAIALGYLQNCEILIHPNAVVLTEEHRRMEQNTLSGISSTMQGSAAATIDKMLRQVGEKVIARDVPVGVGLIKVVDHDRWMSAIGECNHILAEGSQGFSLGVNQRFYPFCTSRECTPYRLLSDMGLPQIPAQTWGTLRTYPIRVGNTPDGHSGDVHEDQTELSFEELGQEVELTTVTQRPRRVFTFSRRQLQEALWHCRPDHLFLNFCNYMDPVSLGSLTDDIESIAHGFNTGIKLCGYGPTFHDVRAYHSGLPESSVSEEVAHSGNEEATEPG